MSKFKILLSMFLISGAVSADLEIRFNNDSTPITLAGSGGAGDIGASFVQLIWSASSPSAQAGVSGALGPGEFLLDSTTAGAGAWGIFDNGKNEYYDTDVGGADINVGYFFVRQFDDDARALDDWYVQFNMAGPTLTDSSDLPPPPNYISANLMPGGAAIDLDHTTYGHQIIPEPTVAALIGLFGGGMLVSRRIFSKKD